MPGLTLALGDIVGSNPEPHPAGAVESAWEVLAGLLAPSVCKVPALVHVFTKSSNSAKAINQ